MTPEGLAGDGEAPHKPGHDTKDDGEGTSIFEVALVGLSIRTLDPDGRGSRRPCHLTRVEPDEQTDHTSSLGDGALRHRQGGVAALDVDFLPVTGIDRTPPRKIRGRREERMRPMGSHRRVVGGPQPPGTMYPFSTGLKPRAASCTGERS